MKYILITTRNKYTCTTNCPSGMTFFQIGKMQRTKRDSLFHKVYKSKIDTIVMVGSGVCQYCDFYEGKKLEGKKEYVACNHSHN